MSFPMTVIALHLGHVTLFLLENNIDTRGRGVGVTTLSPPSSAASKISLVVLILLWVGGGSLLSRRGLFSTRRISRRGVNKLILSTGALLLFFSKFVSSGTL